MKTIAIWSSLILTLLIGINGTKGQDVRSVRYAERQTGDLYMDIYAPQGEVDKKTCVVYVFGGGFVMGSKTADHNVSFFRTLANEGYTVAAIDYRLGLKGVTNVGPLNPKPGFRAVDMAAEDLIDATKYLIDHAQELSIDPQRLIAMGSSAGAITVLQTDYLLANRMPAAEVLPKDFRYAGVVSMAGSVFSTHGKPKYRDGASPTLFFHGTKDRLVIYKKIQVFNMGMFGTDALVKIFHKEGYPFMAIRYEGAEHEVAEFPRQYNLDLICNFMDMAVGGKFDNQVDVLIKDRYAAEHFEIDLHSRRDMYKKENNHGN